MAFDKRMVALEELNGVGEDFSCSFEPAPKKNPMLNIFSHAGDDDYNDASTNDNNNNFG